MRPDVVRPFRPRHPQAWARRFLLPIGDLDIALAVAGAILGAWQ